MFMKSVGKAVVVYPGFQRIMIFDENVINIWNIYLFVRILSDSSSYICIRSMVLVHLTTYHKHIYLEAFQSAGNPLHRKILNSNFWQLTALIS